MRRFLVALGACMLTILNLATGGGMLAFFPFPALLLPGFLSLLCLLPVGSPLPASLQVLSVPWPLGLSVTCTYDFK